MAQSSEYPDLKWMPPKSWSFANRTSVQLIIIHDTEGSEGFSSAEEGAGYDQRRTDGTSTHYFHDQDSTVQCVRTEDISHAARTQGNLRGIQHELCGRADQGATGWADAASAGTLRQAAQQVARDCRKWNIPVRKLSSGQVAAGTKGICGHAEITIAFPQDNGTHTDPGPTFPWGSFISMVQDELESLDMPTPQDYAAAVWGYQLEDPTSTKTPKDTKSAGGYVRYADVLAIGTRAEITKVTDPRFDEIEERFDAIETALADIKTAIAALTPPPA